MSEQEKDGCARDDSWDHLTPAEAYGEGWSDGHETGFLAREESALKIERLEAPYKLTSEPPTVPGWYWVVENDSVTPRPIYVYELKGGLFAGGFSIEGFSRDIKKWSAAPLPLPIPEDTSYIEETP